MQSNDCTAVGNNFCVYFCYPWLFLLPLCEAVLVPIIKPEMGCDHIFSMLWGAGSPADGSTRLPALSEGCHRWANFFLSSYVPAWSKIIPIGRGSEMSVWTCSLPGLIHLPLHPISIPFHLPPSLIQPFLHPPYTSQHVLKYFIAQPYLLRCKPHL